MPQDESLFTPDAWQARARRLHQLHEGPELLILLNPWDRLSALLFASLPGCNALATTSAGIANNLGYPDGEQAPVDAMLHVARQIAAAVDIPVTVDFEAGYGATPTQVAENIRRVVAAGAVGINFEDSVNDDPADVRLRDPAEQAERLDAAREALQVDGVTGVLNARVDVYLLRQGSPDSWMGETIRRCQLYVEHGADCVYVPGIPFPGQSVEDATRAIAQLVREANAPLNVLASSRLPAVSILEEIGVRRMSVGSSVARSAYASARDTAALILSDGDPAVLNLADTLTLSDANRLLSE